MYLNISVNLPFLRFLFFLCAVFKELSQKLLGGDEENRTPDPLLARQVLSQLSYTPTFLRRLTLPGCTLGQAFRPFYPVVKIPQAVSSPPGPSKLNNADELCTVFLELSGIFQRFRAQLSPCCSSEALASADSIERR